MTPEDFRKLIEHGDLDGLRRALDAEPALARGTIRWYLNQWNESDPLHYVCDCLGHGWLTNGREGDVAALLLERGAALEGTGNRGAPLIAAASLGAENVAKVLLEAGAGVERTAVFGARALHWAAWTGEAGTVRLLLARKPDIEARCTEFGATPLFWAVHGYGPDGPKPKKEQVAAARLLIEAGAHVNTTNKYNRTALDLAKSCERSDLYEMLRQTANA